MKCLFPFIPPPSLVWETHLTFKNKNIIIEKIKFSKTDASFTKALEKVKATSKNLSDKAKIKAESQASFEINLPETVKFVDIIEKSDTIDKKTIVYQQLITDKGVKYSVNRLFDVAFDGTLNDVKFQPSRVKSELKGAGVIAGAKYVSDDLLSFAAYHGLTRQEFTAALIGRELKAESKQYVVYFPDIEGDDYSSAPSADALNEAHKAGKAIPGLKTVKRYKLTFKVE